MHFCTTLQSTLNCKKIEPRHSGIRLDDIEWQLQIKQIMEINVAVEQYRFDDDGVIPNNWLPVLVYRQVCLEKNKSDCFQSTFVKNGWTNNWRDVIMPYDHFHSSTHEVLGVGRGHVTLHVGGRSGINLFVEAGDMVILPAGVGHYSLPGSSDYEIVGGYPDGRAWDVLTGMEDDRSNVLARIRAIPIPLTDPLNGEYGTLSKYWHQN